MEGLFIACLWLSFKEISDYTLSRYENIISDFSLDVEKIKKLNLNFPEKFPCKKQGEKKCKVIKIS